MKFKYSYLMLVLALAVAGCAGYFSIWGLSQLFAGASTAVITMAIVLEVSKVMATSALHRYWKRISIILRVYLVTAIVVLMMITSAGIYGFLSNAYQTTANKLEIQTGQVSVLDNKKALFQKNIDDNQKIIDTKNKRIDQLTNLRTTQETRLDSAKNNAAKDKVRNDIQKASDEIQKLSGEIDGLNTKNATLSDSVGVYTVKTLELTSTSQITSEVGPLKYIAALTGYSMAKVVNVLILLFIFVFDPLAIALILMTNRLFEIEDETSVADTKEEPIKEPLIDEFDMSLFADPATKDAFITVSDTVSDTVSGETKTEGVNEGVNEGVKREPVITTGKIELNDIKEIKDRGYSVNVPQPKNSNTIERIGSNKLIKNSDNNKVFFKRD